MKSAAGGALGEILLIRSKGLLTALLSVLCIAATATAEPKRASRNTCAAPSPDDPEADDAAFVDPTVPPPRIEEPGNNELYVEVLGPGIVYSINYARRFGNFALHVGFAELSAFFRREYVGSSASPPFTSDSVFAVPFGVSSLPLRSQVHAMEVGVGATVLYLGAGNTFNGHTVSRTGSETLLLPNFSMGYRLTPRHTGLLLRLGLSGIVTFGGDLPLLPWPYFGFGAVF